MTEDNSSATSTNAPKSRANYLMLAYSILFLFVSAEAVSSNHKVGVVYFLWSEIIYFLADVGNFAYAFRYPVRVHTKYWMAVAFVFVLQVVSEAVLFASNNQDLELSKLVLIWVISLLLYFPAFWANFSIALKKSGGNNIA